MSDGPPGGRVASVPRPALLVVIVLASTLLSVFGADVLFRLYERHFLIHEVPAAAPVYDLAALDYNDAEGTLEAARREGEFRILSFGDSFARSATLPEFSYANVLQRNLSRPTAGRRVRVVNFGRHGTSFPDYLAQLRVWSAQVEFDAVVFNLYAGNDFVETSGMFFVDADEPRYRAGQHGERPRYGPGVDVPRRYPLRLLDYLRALWASRVHAALGTDAAASYQPGAIQIREPVYRATLARHVDVYRADRLGRFLDAHFWLHRLFATAARLVASGVPVAVTVAPSHLVVDDHWRAAVVADTGLDPAAIDPGLPGAVAAALARDAGFTGPLFDWTRCLRAFEAQGDETYWGTNTHWSVRGNEIIGDLLAREIARRWLDAADYPFEAPPDCALDPAALREPARSTLRRHLDAIAMVGRVEETLLPRVAGERFGSPGDLVLVLEAAGYDRDEVAIRGESWGFRRDVGRSFHRPHGLEKVAHPYGWASDSRRPNEPLLVAFFSEGKIAGIGYTGGGDARSSAPSLRDVGAARFDSLIRGPGDADALWVVALSSDDRFALLPIGSPSTP